jgi:hypothetical protein
MELHIAEELFGSDPGRENADQFIGAATRPQVTRLQMALRPLRMIPKRSRVAARNDNKAVTGPCIAG